MIDIPDLSDLFAEARTIDYKKGEYIIRAEDEPQGVYMLETGLVKSFSINNQGEKTIYMVFGEREIFPLGWTLDQTLWHVHFLAVTDTRVRRLPRETFNHLITEGGRHTDMFLKYIAYYLVVYNDRVQNLGYKYAAERIAYRLLFLGRRFGVRNDDRINLSIPLTYDEIADSINLSRKSVQREMDRLLRKKIIEIKGKTITILDSHALNNNLDDGIDFSSWGLE